MNPMANTLPWFNPALLPGSPHRSGAGTSPGSSYRACFAATGSLSSASSVPTNGVTARADRVDRVGEPVLPADPRQPGATSGTLIHGGLSYSTSRGCALKRVSYCEIDAMGTGHRMNGDVGQQEHVTEIATPVTREAAWVRQGFMAGGALFVVFASMWAAEAATGWNAELATSPVGATAWTAAFIGLLGLSQQLRHRSPGASRAGAVLTWLALVGAVVLAVGGFGELAGLWGERPDWLDPLNLLMFLGIIPGFLTVGIAGLRTDVWPKRLSYALLAPAAIFIINLVRLAITEPSSLVSAILGGAQAVAMFTIAGLVGATVRPRRG